MRSLGSEFLVPRVRDETCTPTKKKIPNKENRGIEHVKNIYLSKYMFMKVNAYLDFGVRTMLAVSETPVAEQ